ncbi:MAG: MBL fold metallo-hydrolase [Parachlamydiaceae bacterium]|nr:MBL fold metallo-hydrolase [Parachlamydiaceae bacterium]
MIIRKFFTPGLAITSYIIYDEDSLEGAVIDPTRHTEQYLRCIQQENVNITHILETHVHADFASGAQELKAALKDKPKIVCSSMGGQSWSPHYADQLVNDRDEIMLGSTRLQAWHTPGHTPEHIIWVVYDDRRDPHIPALAFTGDLLFVGSIGRPDLLGEEIQKKLANQLYDTIFHTLPKLPDFIEIYPSHGAGSLCGKGIGARQSSTLGYERKCNQWLQPLPFEEWKEKLLKEMPAAPAYFKTMKQINVTGIDMSSLQQELPPLLTLDQTLKLMATCQIIDVRDPFVFAAGHLKNAINIPLSASFVTWAGAVLSPDKELIIVVGDTPEALFVIQSLKVIGINTIKGICNVSTHHNMQEWLEIQHATPMLSVDEVVAKKNEVHMLDVRTPSEWHSGHIQEAHHIEMALINSSFDLLPKNAPIAVFCHSGTRASIIASLLKSHGFFASVVRGGMQEWLKKGLPSVSG